MKPRDPHELVRQHMAAREKRDYWAARGLKASEAGRLAEAKSALKHAEKWERTMKELEA